MTIKKFADCISDASTMLVEFFRPGKVEDEGVMSHLECALKGKAGVLEALLALTGALERKD